MNFLNRASIDFLLKVGGSVLTDKSKPDIIFHDKIKKICEVLKILYDRGISFTIVTGVGSLGHQAVFKCGAHKGDDGTLERRVGVVEAQIAVNNLRNIFLSAMGKAGIPTFQFYASSVTLSDKMIPQHFHIESLENFLKSNIITVISGDVVPDKTMGFSVMSGDTILHILAKRLNPKIIAYGTNVEGIFDADPQVKDDANLITEISLENNKDLLKNITDGQNIDVSGAMKGKLKAVKKIILNNPEIAVHIFNLNKPENLLKLMDNKEFLHTKITK